MKKIRLFGKKIHSPQKWRYEKIQLTKVSYWVYQTFVSWVFKNYHFYGRGIFFPHWHIYKILFIFLWLVLSLWIYLINDYFKIICSYQPWIMIYSCCKRSFDPPSFLWEVFLQNSKLHLYKCYNHVSFI